MNLFANNQFNTSIWGDEGFSAILSMKSVPEILEIISRDTSPPLWNLTEHLAFQIFGTSEIVIRSLASLYFLLTIVFVYKIGKYLWDKNTGILAAILSFLNPFFFTYAFEGRMYSIMALGVTTSMYFFIKNLYGKKSSIKNQAGYVIGTLWAMYSHHFAIFILFVQGLWFIYEFLLGKRKKALIVLKLFVFVFVGYIPWLIPLYNQTKMVGSGFWLGTPTVKELVGLVSEYLAAGIRTKSLIIPFTNLAFYKMSSCLAVTIILLRKWGKDTKKTLLLLSWFLGPILLTWIVSQFFQSIFFNRYLLYVIPGAMIVLASQRRKAISTLFIAIIIVIFSIIDFHYFTHPTKRPFKELSLYVKKDLRTDDYLINWNAGSHHLWETKYYGIPAPIYIPEDRELPYFVGTALMTEKDILHQIPEDAKRIGVVTSGNIEEVSLSGYTEGVSKKFRNPWEEASEIKFAWFIKDN